MTSKNNLEKGYKEKLYELTEEEVGSLVENLVKEYHKAYYTYDLQEMAHKTEELDDTLEILKTKYNNIENYCTSMKLAYSSNLSVLKEMKNVKANLSSEMMSFAFLSIQLEKNYEILMSILNTYFFNHGDDEVLMKRLDKLIGMLRDNMLNLMKVIEHYHHHFTKKEIDENISSIRRHIHEIIEKDEFKFMKEMDGVDIEMHLIELYNYAFPMEQAYDTIKKCVDDLFEGNNGFKHIIYEIECNMEGISEEKLTELLLEYPQYNIMETKYIPKKY